MRGSTLSHKIRTTIQPDVELDVDDTEFDVLRRSGLLLDTKATTDEEARRAAEKQAALAAGKQD